MELRSDTPLQGMVRRPLRILNRELQQIAYNWQRDEAAGWPVVYQIELTNHCPMTCQMCPRTHSMHRPHGFMSLELFRSIIDQAVRSTPHVFLHHFGDSLLHPALGECIRYASERGIWCYLSANPALLNETRIRALVDNGLHELVLSLDGVTASTSRAVRGPAAENVERAERRIGELIEYRKQAGRTTPVIILQIVRQKQNVHEVDAWLRKWKGMPGVDRVKVKSYVVWNGREEMINELSLNGSPDPTSVTCDKPWTSMTILWDGRVVPCCFDHDGLLTLGNVNDQSLDEIWRGESTRELRRSHRSGDFSNISLCEKCKDKEGYPVGKWYYPFNRLLQKRNTLGDEWQPTK